jgi:predicted DNA-binding protein with PD1-like motif
MSKEGNSFALSIEDAQDLIDKLTEFLTAATVRVARLHACAATDPATAGLY